MSQYFSYLPNVYVGQEESDGRLGYRLIKNMFRRGYLDPIIEKYMSDNSIAILLDKKNIFIASKNYDITKNLITLIDKDIKSIDIE